MKPDIPTLILWIVLPVIIHSCGDKIDNERLLFIAAQIENAPDSAFSMLNTINTEQLNLRDEAHYQILKVRAKDKLGMDISQDTTVFLARDYLIKTNDELAGPACFISAIIYDIQNKSGKALHNYLMAYQLTQNSDNHLLKCNICYNLARIFYNHKVFTESLHYARKAVRYDELAGTQGEIKTYPLELMAFNFYSLKEADSSLIYLHKALKLAERRSTRYRIYQAIAQTYHTNKIFPLAKKKYKQALDNATDSISIGRCYLGFAGVYNEMGQEDSAVYCIHTAKILLESSGNFPELEELFRLQSIIKSTKTGTISYQQLYSLFSRFRNFFDSEKILLEQSNYLKGEIQVLKEDQYNLVLQRQLYFFITLSSILALLFIVFFFLWYRKKSNASHDIQRRRFRKRLQLYEAKMEKERQQYIGQITNLKNTNRNDCIQLMIGLEKIALLREEVSNIKKHKVIIPKEIRDRLKNVIEAYQWDKVYPAMNSAFDGLFDTFMTELIELDEKHRRACCVAYTGLKSRAIAIVLGEELNTTKNRLWKIRNTFGISARGNISHYLNKRFGIPDDSPSELPEENDE